MAILTGIIVGTGQVVNIEVETARVPELQAVAEIAEDFRWPVWDAAENKTKYATTTQLAARFTGSGISQPPVLNGADLEVTVPTELVGSTTLPVPALAGKNYSVYRIDMGWMFTDWYNVISTGGIQLVLPGDKLREGDRFVFHIYDFEAGSIPNPGSPGAGQVDKGFKTIDSASYTILLDDIGYTFNVSGGSNKPIITLPDLEATPDKSVLHFITMVNNDWQTTLQTVNGQFIYIRGQALTKCWLGKGDVLVLKKGDDGWYTIHYEGNFLDAGQPVEGFATMLNTIIAEGQLVRRDSYPRLWDAVQGMGSALVTETLWQSSINYQSCFSSGPDNDTFRMPNIRGLAKRNLDRGRGLDTNVRVHNHPGGYQADYVGPHTHNVIPRAQSDDGEGRIVGGNPGPADGAQETEVNTGTGSGNETTMKNYGVLGLIKT